MSIIVQIWAVLSASYYDNISTTRFVNHNFIAPDPWQLTLESAMRGPINYPNLMQFYLKEYDLERKIMTGKGMIAVDDKGLGVLAYDLHWNRLVVRSVYNHRFSHLV